MALALKQPREASGGAPSIDGWMFWRVRDEKTGDLVTLKEIRRRAAQEL
jgi:hypothetical protein